MKKILVPCDFSIPATHAYRFACELSGMTQAEVHVVHFVELPVVVDSSVGMGPYPIDPGIFKEMEDQAQAAYQRMQEDASVSSPLIRFKTARAYIIQGILSYIKANEIDLVVMGTHGATGLEEILIGSHTEKVVRLSPVPVLVVRKKTSAASIRNIVLPNALELNRTGFINQVKSLQELFQATVHVLLVNTPNRFRKEKEANEALQEFATHYKLERYTLNFRSNTVEEEGILSFAQEIKADVIAMGTHGRRGLAHLFKGSIAESVVNHMDCMIWTTHLDVS